MMGKNKRPDNGDWATALSDPAFAAVQKNGFREINVFAYERKHCFPLGTIKRVPAIFFIAAIDVFTIGLQRNLLLCVPVHLINQADFGAEIYRLACDLRIKRADAFSVLTNCAETINLCGSPGAPRLLWRTQYDNAHNLPDHDQAPGPRVLPAGSPDRSY